MVFQDRSSAGQLLIKPLSKYRGKNVAVCGLPRGGIIVAEPVARHFRSSLIPVLVRKIGHPENPEYAIAAVTPDGYLFENEAETEKVTREWLVGRKNLEQVEILRRQKMYRVEETLPVSGKTVIIIDDGIATGLTLLASVRYVRSFRPEKIIVAVPVAPSDFIVRLSLLVEDVICLETAAAFKGSVGAYYEAFPQIDDTEVISALSSFL